MLITAEACAAFAPAAATDDQAFVLDRKISAVLNQLPVNAKNLPDGGVHLR